MKKLLQKNKHLIIILPFLAALLIGAFLWGGKYPKIMESTVPVTGEMASAAKERSQASTLPSGEESSKPETPAPAGKEPSLYASHRVGQGANPQGDAGEGAAAQADSFNAQTRASKPQGTADSRLAEPSPDGTPSPVKSQDEKAGTDKFTCTLSVSCKIVLEHMDLLEEDKRELIPEDGILVAPRTATFQEGDSVFDVLQREMRTLGIPMEFQNTPLYDSAYILGINNLYEFDVGELSGWVYEVNGQFPSFGCSRYLLQDGDVVIWHYTCNLGKDVGGSNGPGG